MCRRGRGHPSKPRGEERAAGPFGGLPLARLSAATDKAEIRLYRDDREKQSTGGMNGLGRSFSEPANRKPVATRLSIVIFPINMAVTTELQRQIAATLRLKLVGPTN